MFEPYPPEADGASFSDAAQDNIFAVKKMIREIKKTI